MGKNVTLVGGNGDGQTTKVANQIIVALNIAAVGEALVFAEQGRGRPAKVRQALMGGLPASRILEVHGERMVKRSFAPGFRIGLHQKDLNLALQGPGAGRGAAADGRGGAADAGLRGQRHARTWTTRHRARARADGPPHGHARRPNGPSSPLRHAEDAVADRRPAHAAACTTPRSRARAAVHNTARLCRARRADGPSCSAPARLAARWRRRSMRWHPGRAAVGPGRHAVRPCAAGLQGQPRPASRWSKPRTRCPTLPAGGQAQRIAGLARGLTADDLVLCLISGGGSACSRCRPRA